MSIKFKNVPISDKKNKTKNGFNLFFFKKFLYIIAIDGVKKKNLPLVKNVSPPSDSSQLPRDPQHGQQGEVDDHGHLSESECV